MRLTSWTILTLTIILTGCNSFGRRGGSSGSAVPTGRNATPPPAAERIATGAPPGGNNARGPAYGVIAGRVLDTTNRQANPAFVQVREVGNVPVKEAPIEAPVDRQGYFLIQGLQAGKTYELTARVNGAPNLMGSTTATPPNARVLIKLAANYTQPRPPAPAPAAPPPEPVAPTNPTTSIPRPTRAAELGPPVGIPGYPGLAPPTQQWQSQTRPPAPTPPSRDFAEVRPENIANERDRGIPPTISIRSSSNDWTPSRTARPAVPVRPTPPPAPPVRTVQPPPQVRNVQPPPPSFDPGPARVPSCVLTGQTLHNFALNDLDGRPFEFRQRRGKLVLIDFWGSWCIPCLRTIPRLNDLQARYGPYGLEVIGIAYEKGSPQENAAKIKHVRDRLRVNYRLLQGSGLQSCPVKTQFGVRYWPTLVLVDQSGRILWRGEGADPAHLRELEIIIRQQLGV